MKRITIVCLRAGMLLGIMCLFVNWANAQRSMRWEDVTQDFGPWKIDHDLYVLSGSLQQLRIANQNAASETHVKNGTIDFRNAVMDMNWKETDPYEVTFNLKNEHANPYSFKYKVYGKKKSGKFKEQWHEDGIHWGMHIELYGLDGSVLDNKVWYCALKGYYGTKYRENVNDEGWKNSISDHIPNGEVRIAQNYGNVSVSVANKVIGEWANVGGIKSITIMVGSAAQISVTNFTVKRGSGVADYPISRSKYRYRYAAYEDCPDASIQSLIRKGDELMDRELYNEAVIQYDLAIYRGCRNADIYIRRACANVLRDYLYQAIEDCNTALYYDWRNEDALYLMGLCKLSLDDYTGVDDLRCSGERGLALLRELGLDTYYPMYDSYPYYKKVRSSSRKVKKQMLRHETKQSVQKLTKDPDFKIEMESIENQKKESKPSVRSLRKDPNFKIE